MPDRPDEQSPRDCEALADPFPLESLYRPAGAADTRDDHPEPADLPPTSPRISFGEVMARMVAGNRDHMIDEIFGTQRDPNDRPE